MPVIRSTSSAGASIRRRPSSSFIHSHAWLVLTALRNLRTLAHSRPSATNRPKAPTRWRKTASEYSVMSCGRLEKLNDVSGRVLQQDLLAPRSRDDVVAELGTGGTQLSNFRLDI